MRPSFFISGSSGKIIRTFYDKMQPEMDASDLDFHDFYAETIEVQRPPRSSTYPADLLGSF
jgi:hypothetical protein